MESPAPRLSGTMTVKFCAREGAIACQQSLRLSALVFSLCGGVTHAVLWVAVQQHDGRP